MRADSPTLATQSQAALTSILTTILMLTPASEQVVEEEQRKTKKLKKKSLNGASEHKSNFRHNDRRAQNHHVKREVHRSLQSKN